MSNETFQPADRRIFSYADGSGKVVCADPLVIKGKLATFALQSGKTVQGLIDAANAVNLKDATEMQVSESWNALGTLADISERAFELVPFNKETGSGADMAHALGVLNHFHLWCKKKRQTPDLPPISIPPSESTSATPQITATSSASP